jgi:glutamate-5-semialdehyde dehydrogenase
VILRGGHESQQSTAALTQVAREALQSAGVPADGIQAVADPNRELVRELLQARGGVDVVVPRGGPGLIDFVTETASVPVIETGWGVCHTYVDADTDLAEAERIVVNAKTRRPSICNALDTLLVHRSAAAEFLPVLGRALAGKNVEIHADPEAILLLEGIPKIVPLTNDDLDTEWLGLRMSVALVGSLDEALVHIQSHGSGHSEAIVTRSPEHAERFLDEVDAAAVYVNTSTQFTDGGEFGLGAEVGISTQKLHARGPMGLREMTTYKWIVRGNGQVRPL